MVYQTKATLLCSILAGDEKERTSVGETITVQGWVRSRRDSKAGLSFIQITDGSCFDLLQIVADKDLSNYESEVLHITTGTSVVITGELVESQGKGQSVELQATEVKVEGFVEDPDTYPVAAKRHTFEYLRTVSHLRTRTNTFAAIARVRDCLSQAVHRYFHNNKFLWVHTPIITASDCEGAGEMFRCSTLDLVNTPMNESGEVDFDKDFFGKEAFLTVSGQIN
ncbi:MAG: asparagine--tRNA ligase, partial [Phycisphaerales bacterium]|nr:asparagine--tRNA ligase [Phycisphaerales bacterium]